MNEPEKISLRDLLNSSDGMYGDFGGSFIPELFHDVMRELTRVYAEIRDDPGFWDDYYTFLKEFSGRPTPITRLGKFCANERNIEIFAKREDLGHTGSHKINNVIGQGMVAKRLGKPRVIAETGAGQHGVATATMAAKMGFDCTIYMGEVDVRRQRPNVFWMEQMGAKVVAVTDGTKTLKDAINSAMRDWSANLNSTHYVLGTVCGAHPFPAMATFFQSVIGKEARAQMLEVAGRLPSRVYACVGGGSNASGLFSGFLEDDVRLIGVEAGGKGIETGHHAARFTDDGAIGVAQGYKTRFLQNPEGIMNETSSIAAGLDYVGVGPILAWLESVGRVEMESATDKEVVEAAKRLIRTEGLIPALESAHSFARVLHDLESMDDGECILINQSGRGDKDIFNVADAIHDPEWMRFILQTGERYLEADPSLAGEKAS
ncbi:MAG: tryptophan synthase subunit beta [Verrucomicrobiota bacterium]